MTTPKVSTISRGGSRFYVNPETHEKVPGVTSILGSLGKPFLQHWAAKVVAEFAVDNFGAYSALIMNGQRQAAVDVLKAAPRRYTTERADIGTEAHDLFERLGRGEDLGRIRPEMQGYVDQWHLFNEQFRPNFLMQEETVWSDKHRYAGSFDAIAEIGGETVILDYKTSKAVYAETALQMAAYRYADYIVRPDGNRVPLPKGISGGAVVHIHPDRFDVVPMLCDEAIFEMFLQIRNGAFEWQAEASKKVVGKPLAPLHKGA
jgi:hypothetical protein